MTTKHTPGPWSVTHDDMHHTYVWRSGDELPDSLKISIAQVHYNRESNARLMAAAPDLLAALEAIGARINGEWDNPALVPFGELSTSAEDDVQRIAREAIAAAKGEA